MANNLPIWVQKCATTKAGNSTTTSGVPNILIIDPNKLNDNGDKVERYVSPEDLIMYVEVRAFMNPKSRVSRKEGEPPESLLISKNKWYSSSNPKYAENQTKDFFTTNWTEMFDAKKPYDTEGFGVQNIDVEFNASLVPKIHIEFIDVRGKNLLEKGNSPDNPYNVFYMFPYPLFQLTVKGFFGKTISMPLVMEKAITRLDPSTGNYVISADFRSWTFAILNDLPLLYALIVPFMFAVPSGNGNSITATYKGQQIIDELFATYHAQHPTVTNDQIAISKLFLLSQEIPKDISKDSVVAEIKKKTDAIDALRDALVGFKSALGAIMVDKVASDPQKWTALKEQFTIINNTFQEKLGVINEGSAVPLTIDYTKIFTETYFQDPADTTKISEKKYIADDGAEKSISADLTKYNAEQTQNALLALGNIFRNALQFVPSVENVVKVIMIHIEAFIRLLILKTEEIYASVLDNKHIITDKQRAEKHEIYEVAGQQYRRLPWPEYYYDPRRGNSEPIKNYPRNDLGNKEVQEWGEVLFIEEMYAAFERAQTFIAQMGTPSNQGQGLNEVFVWTPFSIPVGKNLVPNGKNQITLVREALERMLCAFFYNGIIYKATDVGKRTAMVNEWVKNDLESTITSLINSSDQTAFSSFKSLWNTSWEALMKEMKSKFPNEHRILENIGHSTYSSTPFSTVGYVALHENSVKLSAVPTTDVVGTYNNITDVQQKTISANQLPVDTLKLASLNIYDTNTPTMIGDTPVSALTFTNNYTVDDIFLCRS